MEFFETAEKRFSYRGKYSDTKPTRDELVKIVEVGIRAPSGCNAQTTYFVIVDDADLIAKIDSIVPHVSVRTAPAMIVVATEKKCPYGDTSFEMEDYSAATQNILLAITASGYASVWLDGAVRAEGRDKYVAELLNLPEHLTVRVLLPVGVPAEDPGPKRGRKPFEQRAWFNTYSEPCEAAE